MRHVRAALLALALLATAGTIPSAVHAQEIPDTFVGDLPPDGGTALVALVRDMRPSVLLDALSERGCEASSLAVAREGEVLVHVVGAPAFVNAEFPRLLPLAGVVIVRCEVAPVVAPDLGMLTVVSKERALPDGYAPTDLVALPVDAAAPGAGGLLLIEEAAGALDDLLTAAREAGFDLRVRSAYRSYAEQVGTYQHWVRVYGPEEAARRSAEPGHSEHQLGTTLDFTTASVDWELAFELDETPEGRWLHRYAGSFGFVMSYPDGAEEITGYRYEPWHFRYVGRTHADWLAQSGLALIEYLREMEAAAP